MSENLSEFLEPGPMVESCHPDIVALAANSAQGASTNKEKSVWLYYKIRDGIRYDPYASSVSYTHLTLPTKA